jgi:hypothetical protein
MVTLTTVYTFLRSISIHGLFSFCDIKKETLFPLKTDEGAPLPDTEEA